MTIEERKYEEVRKEIYAGLDNDKDRWMQEYIKVVYDIIEKKFKSYKANHYNDMINAGVLGLLMAKAKFNEEKGTKFTTYAYISIHNAIVSYIRNIYGEKLGRNKWQRCYKKVKELVKQGVEYERGWIVMRDSEKLDRYDFYVLWTQATGNDVSYEMMLERSSSKQGVKGNTGNWYDITDEGIDVEGEVIRRDMVEQVYEYIRGLEDRRKREICEEYVESVIKGRVWRGIDIATRLGVSRQWVSLVVGEMCEKLKERNSQ